MHSCIGYEEQYACNDYYQIRNDGDSMIIISTTKSIWTDKEEQDTTILYLDGGQFKTEDGSLFLSNKTDTSYLRKPVYHFQEEKQVLSINRKDGLNYSTIQTYYVDYRKQSAISTRFKNERVLNSSWRLFMSTTFIYDDNYRIVNILQNGMWFFPVHLFTSSDEYILKNKDIITCKKGGNDMTITKNLNGTALEIALAGRLDTMTAPELEAELNKDLGGADSLTLDFGKLDYISSAGLRVLLTAHKAMAAKGGMKICNVNEVVQEVFEVTGFADILTIE